MSVYITMKKQLIEAHGEAGKWAAYEVYGMNSRGGTRAGENRLEEDFSMALELFARVPSLDGKPQPYVRKAVRNAVLQGRKADSGGRVVVRDGHQIEAMTGVDMEGNRLEIGETANQGDADRILDLLWRAFERVMNTVISRLDGTPDDAELMKLAMDSWYQWARVEHGQHDVTIHELVRRNGMSFAHVAEDRNVTKREVQDIVERIDKACAEAFEPLVEARNDLRFRR
jgi:hypothetical protein